MRETVYVYGKNPLKEALIAGNRNNVLYIQKLFLTKQAEEQSEIMSLVQSNSLKYDIVTAQEIESMVGRSALHQGVCAELYEGKLYTALEEVLEKTKTKKGNALFVLLDKLEDPHNVGAIIRSAAAFGADAILIGEHDQVQLTGTVIKSASGMNFTIPIVKIGNINTILKQLQAQHFWVYGLTGDGDTTLRTVVFDSNTVIVVGSEGNGIREKTLEYCDFKLSIETNPLCESLNASNASAVVMYEWSKQQAVTHSLTVSN